MHFQLIILNDSFGIVYFLKDGFDFISPFWISCSIPISHHLNHQNHVPFFQFSFHSRASQFFDYLWPTVRSMLSGVSAILFISFIGLWNFFFFYLDFDLWFSVLDTPVICIKVCLAYSLVCVLTRISHITDLLLISFLFGILVCLVLCVQLAIINFSIIPDC